MRLTLGAAILFCVLGSLVLGQVAYEGLVLGHIRSLPGRGTTAGSEELRTGSEAWRFGGISLAGTIVLLAGAGYLVKLFREEE